MKSGKLGGHLSPQDMLALVELVVPKKLPTFLREEVCQEIMLALLSHKLKAARLNSTAVKGFITQLNKSYSNAYSHISLDQPIAEGYRLEDILEG